MDKICQYFNITKHNATLSYNSIRLVNTHTIDDDVGSAVLDGSIKYVSKMNINCKNKKNNGSCNTVVDMNNINKITDYGATAITTLNALHVHFLKKPIYILNCQEQVLRQLNKAAGTDMRNLLIGNDDLERLYGPVKHHTEQEHN
jgi:hypothetical protein